MHIIGGPFADSILRFFAPRKESTTVTGGLELNDTKLVQFFGENFYNSIAGKTVIDFGCGAGRESVLMAKMGAAKVIGLDIQRHLFVKAQELAVAHGVKDKCIFVSACNEKADIIISKDAFEHFADPLAILRDMRRLLRPEGYVIAAFGPTWLHPYGGHLFSVFPWAHLIFSEDSLIRWRSNYRNDGAQRFSEVDGGLNRLTIAGFEKIVSESPFLVDFIETVPIRGITAFKSRLLREFGSSIVRCRLVPRDQDAGAVIRAR